MSKLIGMLDECPSSDVHKLCFCKVACDPQIPPEMPEFMREYRKAIVEKIYENMPTSTCECDYGLLSMMLDDAISQLPQECNAEDGVVTEIQLICEMNVDKHESQCMCPRCADCFAESFGDDLLCIDCAGAETPEPLSKCPQSVGNFVESFVGVKDTWEPPPPNNRFDMLDEIEVTGAPCNVTYVYGNTIYTKLTVYADWYAVLAYFEDGRVVRAISFTYTTLEAGVFPMDYLSTLYYIDHLLECENCRSIFPPDMLFQLRMTILSISIRAKITGDIGDTPLVQSAIDVMLSRRFCDICTDVQTDAQTGYGATTLCKIAITIVSLLLDQSVERNFQRMTHVVAQPVDVLCSRCGDKCRPSDSSHVLTETATQTDET
jgi:hypothetical protein